MTNSRIQAFRDTVGYQTLFEPYESEDDAAITAFVWLLHVPFDRLCEVEDAAVALSFELFGDDPVPFVIGVASPAKTLILLTELKHRFVRNPVNAPSPSTWLNKPGYANSVELRPGLSLTVNSPYHVDQALNAGGSASTLFSSRGHSGAASGWQNAS